MLKSVVMFYGIKCPKDNFRAESPSNINNAICLNALIRFWLLWNSIWAFLRTQNWFKYFIVAKSNGERYVTHSQSLDHSLSAYQPPEINPLFLAFWRINEEDLISVWTGGLVPHDDGSAILSWETTLIRSI